MSERNLITFLQTVAVRADVLGALERLGKDEVIAAAAAFGLPFTEAEFDRLIWDLEAHLAAKRGEAFDAHFPLWETMWGQSYFAYLVKDVIPSLKQDDIDDMIARGPRRQNA
jgi:hypothetical protein